MRAQPESVRRKKTRWRRWLPVLAAAGVLSLFAATAALGLGEGRILHAEPEGRRMSSAVIAPDGKRGYFGTDSRSSLPGQIIEVDLGLMRTGRTLSVAAGENVVSAVIDPAGDFAYFGVAKSFEGRVVKVNLADFSIAGNLTLGTNGIPRAAAIDSDGTYAYFSSRNNPGTMTRIDLSTFTAAGTVALPSGVNNPVAAATDPDGDHLYVGANAYVSPDGDSLIGKVDLETGEAFTAEIPADYGHSRVVLVDPDGEYGYFATYGAPARVVKVELDTFTIKDTIHFERHENNAVSGVMSPDGNRLFIGTESGHLVEVDLTSFSRADMFQVATAAGFHLRSAVIDPAGTRAYFGMGPGWVSEVLLDDSAGPAPTFDFIDVHDAHVFAGEIGWLAADGITRGCNPPHNSRFCPEDPVTRGQMAAFLTRGLNLAPATRSFTDTTGHVFEADIGSLAEAGITRGCNPPQNTRFCPDDRVTRGQMAAFLSRALELQSSDQGFDDTVGHVFESDVASLAASGITRGCNPPQNTRFCPDDPVTRGQMAAFLYRALSTR